MLISILEKTCICQPSFAKAAYLCSYNQLYFIPTAEWRKEAFRWRHMLLTFSWQGDYALILKCCNFRSMEVFENYVFTKSDYFISLFWILQMWVVFNEKYIIMFVRIWPTRDNFDSHLLVSKILVSSLPQQNVRSSVVVLQRVKVWKFGCTTSEKREMSENGFRTGLPAPTHSFYWGFLLSRNLLPSVSNPVMTWPFSGYLFIH